MKRKLRNLIGYAIVVGPVAFFTALAVFLSASVVYPPTVAEPTSTVLDREMEPTVVPAVWIPMVMKDYRGLSRKKGVGIPDGISCDDLWDAGIRHLRSWGYTGARKCPGMTSTAGVRDMDQLWSAVEENRIGGGIRVIGPNECDMQDQCNQSPEDMVIPMHTLITTFDDREFGTPSQFGDTQWLIDFYAGYELEFGHEPNFYFVDCHCYWDNVELCKQHVCWYMQFAEAHNIGEVWLTEYAFGHWYPEGATDRTAEFVAWLEDDEAIRDTCGTTSAVRLIRHYWFSGYIQGDESWYPNGWYTPNLFYIDGRLTEFGLIFKEA